MKEETLRMFVCLFFDVFLEKITQFFRVALSWGRGWCVSKRATANCIMTSVEVTTDHLQCCNPTRNITKLTKHPQAFVSQKVEFVPLGVTPTHFAMKPQDLQSKLVTKTSPLDQVKFHLSPLGLASSRLLWMKAKKAMWVNECCNCFLPQQRRRASSECKLAVFVLFSNARLSVNRRLLMPFSEIYLFEWAFHEWNGIFCCVV